MKASTDGRSKKFAIAIAQSQRAKCVWISNDPSIVIDVRGLGDKVSSALSKMIWNSTSFQKTSVNCKMGGIVQGDDGPVCGVAQVVDCHGVTVGNEEKEEEEIEQEVESDGEKTLKERCACPWMR